jgi:Ca-activated chloride channel family protein
MTLLQPLFLVPAALCLAAAWWLRLRAGEDGWARIMSARVLALLRPRAGLRQIDLALLALAVVFAALASPALRADAENSYALNEGVLVLADVSKSMTLDDVRPSRMSAAREAVLAISASAGARATALIVYAGDAYLAEPFATDRRQLDAYAGALEYGLIQAGGSDLGRALALARSVIAQSGVAHARIVVVTDGGGFDGSTSDIARRFAQRGHRLDAVLVARPETVTPVAVDTNLVETVAAAGDGAMLAVDGNGNVDLGPLQLDGTLLSFPTATGLSLLSTDWQNQSHYLLLAALPLMLLLFRRSRI